MKKYQINLIQKKNRDFADTIIYFFLHYLRYIIVLTQTVVILVFFFRFQVDQEIIDLKESIDQKQEIMKVTKPLVVEAQVVDGKIGQVKKILDAQESFLKNTHFLFSVIPQEVSLSKFEMEKNTIQFTGITTNAAIIQLFNEKLKKMGNYKNITITELAKIPTGFSFSMLIEVK